MATFNENQTLRAACSDPIASLMASTVGAKMSSTPVHAARVLRPARSTTIDAFRGIAAVGVVIQHLLLCWPDPIVATLHSAVYYTPLEALFSDGKFIRIFFVISGFVMFLPFDKPSGFRLSEFYRRRFWRVYPAFVVAIAISIGMQMLSPQLGAVADATRWFYEDTHAHDIGWQRMLQLALFSGTSDSIKINCVTWSLVQEARIILLFPLLAYCVRSRGSLSLLASIVASVIATAVYPMVGETGYFITAETGIGTVCTTLHFLPLFVIGMLLARHLDLFGDLVIQTNAWQRIALWGLAFLLMRRPQEYIAGSGTALLLVLSMRSSTVTRVLATPPLQWLGKRSYSLYLLHIPVLLMTLHVLGDAVPIAYGLLAAFVVSLVVADAFETHVAAVFAAKGTKRPPQAAPKAGWLAPSWLVAHLGSAQRRATA